MSDDLRDKAREIAKELWLSVEHPERGNSVEYFEQRILAALAEERERLAELLKLVDASSLTGAIKNEIHYYAEKVRSQKG